MLAENDPLAPKKKRSRDAQKAGGIARARRLSPGERSEIATRAAEARWGSTRRISPSDDASLELAADDLIVDQQESIDLTALPVAQHRGVLRLLNFEIPCYVLSDGRRVIGRTSAAEMLTGIKGGGGSRNTSASLPCVLSSMWRASLTAWWRFGCLKLKALSGTCVG